MPISPPRHRADPQKSLVGFVVGDVHYAVDIIRVREIVNPLGATSLPHMPSEVAGVADYRGEDVPVIDLRARFGLPSREADRATKWILVVSGGKTLGLIVDSVTEVFGAQGDEIRSTPDVGGDKQLRGISGVTTHDGKLTFLLDTARLAEIVDWFEAEGTT